MKILIDISNIIPGKGGSGGGIWVYALNLLAEMDKNEGGNGLSILCFKNPANKELTFSNIKLIDSPIRQDSALGHFFWVNIYLPAYCVKHRVNVIHRVVPEMPLFAFTKSIVTLHDLMFNYYLRNPRLFRYLTIKDRVKFRFLNRIVVWAMRRSDAILVPSQSIKYELQSKYPFVNGKVMVTPEAVDVRHSAVRDGAETRDKLFRIMVVAGFYPHKGYMHVLNVAKQLLCEGNRHFLVTLRGNPAFARYQGDIVEAIEKMGLREHVTIAPFVKEHSLSDIYRSQDCFLLMSEYEGFGLPVLEAQQFGLPVLCSDIPVFRELLKDSALYLNIDDLSVSCSQVVKLMQSASLRQMLRNKGFANVKDYSWAKMANETIEAYKKLS